MNRSISRASFRSGFSLVELMVAMTVLLIMLGLIFSITKGTTDVWKNSTGKTEGFRDARGAFEAMTRTVSQATLNTYFDYADGSGFRTLVNASTFTPTKYARRSDLHFICGKTLLTAASVTYPTTHSIFFQAPLGYSNDPLYKNMESLLNACGFYVCYGPDPAKPAYMASNSDRNRFRLMQFTQTSEALSLYDPSVTQNNANWNSNLWFTAPLASQAAATPFTSVLISQLAENVVALVVLPKYAKSDKDATDALKLSPDYEYNSRSLAAADAEKLNQLPPVVQIVMVFIDEASAVKLGNTATPPDLGVSSLFQTADKLQEDIATLEKNLGALPGNAAGNKIPLRYEIYQTEVAIRGSKFDATPQYP